MNPVLAGPANTTFFSLPAPAVYTFILLAGFLIFLYMVLVRARPLLSAAPDPRCRHIPRRIVHLLKYWLLQYRHPRYLLAGVLHIFLFAGFVILLLRTAETMFVGIFPGFRWPGMDGMVGGVYDGVRGYAATWVLIVAVISMVRRGIFKPRRYDVPAKYGKAHTGEAIFVLSMICILMLTESLFEASLAAAQIQSGLPAHRFAPVTLSWIWTYGLAGAPVAGLQWLHLFSYFLHDVTLFTFLCFLPQGKHFHVVTSVFNVFFMRLQRGNIKPVRYDVPEDKLDDLDSFGVKKLEDFTYKHMLDFYTCADCGRCSDNCPANTVGRPLSPRFISIKGRDLLFARYPLFGKAAGDKNEPLIGTTYEEDEIWSCTTCGACEQECPLCIEYIDKIVDLRRGMVDDGLVPQSLQKPLSAVEKRGNPWGLMERKRADWTKDLGEEVAVKIVDGKQQAELLYFVDSITSFDDRMQAIGRATATLLHRSGADFGILGKAEKDSGHEVRRFGEEMLFQQLRDHNAEMIAASGARRIVTADPHAYNALKNDYPDMPAVEHISQYLARAIENGDLTLKPLADDQDKVYVYHDPCYLGRHNQLYDTPRRVIDALPAIKRVEMARCRDRAFCCGGGGLMLFYEPREDQRMGVLRVQMAAEAGANVIVTACPFCLVNIEDGIKVAGLEGQMAAIDLTELVVKHLA